MTPTEFEHTLLQTRPKMMATAMRFFHDKEDAEDVVQEVCMRMLERGWREGDSTEALLIKATKNLCVSIWRRQKAFSPLFPCGSASESAGISSIALSQKGSGEEADAPLLLQEQQEQLEQAIAGLPPSEQRFIRMKSEELSIEEMAQQVGVSKRTASTMLWQAKKRLLTFLKINNDD